MNAVDTPSQRLADAITAMLEEEQRFSELCRQLSDVPGANTALLEESTAVLRCARVEAGRALTAALAADGTWVVRSVGGTVTVQRAEIAPRPPPARIQETNSASSPPPPAVVPASRPAPSSPPADPASLARLAAVLGGGQSWRQETPADVPGLPLDGLPRPELVRDLRTLEVWVQRFERAVEDRSSWTRHPRPTQRAVLALVTTLGRHLQDAAARIGGGVSLIERVSGRFPELTRFSKEEQPGFVWGLSLEHGPRRGAWLVDARAAWDVLFAEESDQASANIALSAVLDAADAGMDDEALRKLVTEAFNAGVSSSDKQLVAALTPRLSAFHGRTEANFPTLRGHLKDHLQREREAEEAEDHAHPLPGGWPWAGRTAGMRVLALGGDDRDDVVARWKEAFGFADVIWDTGWNVRRVQSDVERISSRQFDLVVIVKRFITHAATNLVIPACKEAGVPFLPIESGYGTSQLRLSIERWLPPAG